MGLTMTPAPPFQTNSVSGGLGFTGLAPAANANPMMQMPGLDLNFGSQGSSAVPMTQMSLAGSMDTGNGMGIGDWQAPPAAGAGAAGMDWASTPWASKAQTIMGGIGQLGKLYAAFQANKLGQESLKFQKQSFRENMDNQKTSFNMSLEDRASSRAGFAGSTPEATQAAADYIARHRLEK